MDIRAGSSVKTVEETDDGEALACGMVVRSRNARYKLYIVADGEFERDQWVAAVQRAIENNVMVCAVVGCACRSLLLAIAACE